jgi:hypothetical protein
MAAFFNCVAKTDQRVYLRCECLRAPTVWPVSGILGTAALVSILVMGGFTILALVRLADTDFA